jgi:outer membrane protein OmpA-like peptidoglycan-associated protein
MVTLLRALVLAAATAVFAQATLPTADRKGSTDHPLLKRYEGSFVVASEQKAFAAFALPLSRLEVVTGQRDQNRNRVHEPRNKKPLEGPYTRLVYLIPANRSPLEVMRNYDDEIKSKGGKTLFECQGPDCGGNATRSSGGGSGDMSMAMYLYPAERVTDKFGTNGHCAVAGGPIADQRYMAAEIPNRGAHVSILTYSLQPRTPACKAFSGRTIAVIDIVESKPRETKMVTVNASEMASAISTAGRVALYGILFDFNKADINPASEPTLEQIGKLLKGQPALKLLVVGHTDNVGTFPFNMDLSLRRAAAVVVALTSRYGATKDRLFPVGVSYASPVAPNSTEDGRAKNRRVELVENASATR